MMPAVKTTTPTPTTTTPMGLSSSRRRKNRRPSVFPKRLYNLLDNAERDGYNDIISWLPDGTTFQIFIDHHDEDHVVDLFKRNNFNLTKYKSITKQLTLYNFQRISKGCYRHELFVRGRPDLFHKKSMKDFVEASSKSKLSSSLQSSLSHNYQHQQQQQVQQVHIQPKMVVSPPSSPSLMSLSNTAETTTGICGINLQHYQRCALPVSVPSSSQTTYTLPTRISSSSSTSTTPFPMMLPAAPSTMAVISSSPSSTRNRGVISVPKVVRPLQQQQKTTTTKTNVIDQFEEMYSKNAVPTCTVYPNSVPSFGFDFDFDNDVVCSGDSNAAIDVGACVGGCNRNNKNNTNTDCSPKCTYEDDCGSITSFNSTFLPVLSDDEDYDDISDGYDESCELFDTDNLMMVQSVTFEEERYGHSRTVSSSGSSSSSSSNHSSVTDEIDDATLQFTANEIKMMTF